MVSSNSDSGAVVSPRLPVPNRESPSPPHPVPMAPAPRTAPPLSALKQPPPAPVATSGSTKMGAPRLSDGAAANHPSFAVETSQRRSLMTVQSHRDPAQVTSVDSLASSGSQPPDTTGPTGVASAMHPSVAAEQSQRRTFKKGKSSRVPRSPLDSAGGA